MPSHFRQFYIDGQWYSAETRTMLGFWSIRDGGGKPLGEIFQRDGKLKVHGKRVTSLRAGIIALRDAKEAK